jgi:hypothetical protein
MAGFKVFGSIPSRRIVLTMLAIVSAISGSSFFTSHVGASWKLH